MRKILCSVLYVIFMVALCSCSADSEPQDGTYIETPTTTLVQENTVEQPSLEPEEEQRIGLSHLKELSIEFSIMYNYWEQPIFYPADEDMLEKLRDLLTRNEETESLIKFDVYEIAISSYGFGLKVNSPRDFWGNPYYIWLEVMPTDISVARNTLVSAGPDGIFSFKGVGEDYSSTGFGDDLVLFLNTED